VAPKMEMELPSRGAGHSFGVLSFRFGAAARSSFPVR